MKANEIVKALMSSKGITQGDITKMWGMKSQSGISQVLSRDMKTSNFVRFLSTLDCELIVRDKEGTEYKVEE